MIKRESQDLDLERLPDNSISFQIQETGSRLGSELFFLSSQPDSTWEAKSDLEPKAGQKPSRLLGLGRDPERSAGESNREPFLQKVTGGQAPHGDILRKVEFTRVW